MLLKGMLKWAIAKEDRRDARNQCQSSSSNNSSQQSNSSSNNSSPCISTSNSTKSLLRKRRKLSHSSLLGKGGEVELISGTKNRNQNQSSNGDGGCYLKQQHHHHPQQPQPRWCINNTNTNSASNLNNDNGPSPTDPRNTCKKNNHSAKPKTASHKIGNDSNNCIINTSVSLNNNNNNDPSNCGTNADSKSLLYMSLDHLPLAIVKQYERMLQDQEHQDNGDKNNNNNSSSNHRYDQVSDHIHNPIRIRNEDDEEEPEKQSLAGSGTGPGKTGRGGKVKNKKCLSFATSTLPSRSLFKSKSIHNQKKIILPLHGPGVSITPSTSSAGTSSKSLQSATTKLVKQTKIVTSNNNRRISTVSIEQNIATTTKTMRDGVCDTECRPPQAVSASTKVSTTKTATTSATATKSTSISSPSLSPSPSSVSISASVGSAAGGTEIIRHARSRSLRTSSSFKTKVNEEQNPKNPHSNSNNTNSNSPTSETTNANNPPFIYSPSNSHKSSTLPRARNQHSHSDQQTSQFQTVNNNHKSMSTSNSILSSAHAKPVSNQNQSTQTFKSILKNKNPLELNNNNFTTANQNSLTIENLDLASPIRRPFQSLLNVSTLVHPPTPSTTTPASAHPNQRIRRTNLTKLMKTNQVDDEEEDDDDGRVNEVNLADAHADIDADFDIERRDVIRRPKPAPVPAPATMDKFHHPALRFHGLEERLREQILPNKPKRQDDQEQDADHDTTDPQFLEKSLTFSFPAVARCAKKLTLKRSELRKLERIRSQTDRLNRFLRKYYHECLPNLPEQEEVSQCSPEEKSVSILRTHWIEDKKLARSHSHSQRLGSPLDTLDEETLTDLFNSNSTETTTSSSSSGSSVSGSTEESSSGSSTCSSSSSDLDWKGYCILNGNGKSHTGSGSGPGHGHSQRHSGNRHNNHNNNSSRKSRSRQKRHSRSVLSNNETTLLPIIQEDSAEVSSASVKSLESRSRSHSQNGEVQAAEVGAEIPDNLLEPRHNQPHNKDPSNCTTTGSGRRDAVRTGRDGCPGGDISNLSRNDDDDSRAVKRDNMGDVKDHSRDIYSRNTFVTEGAETDLRKLKGSFKKMDCDEPFDLPTTPHNPNLPALTTLPFAEENLRRPQLGFTLIAPHPSSSLLPLTGSGSGSGTGTGTGTCPGLALGSQPELEEMRFEVHVHETVGCCMDSQSTSSCGSHSHGYGSGTTSETARTDKSDPDADGYVGVRNADDTGPIVSNLTSTHSVQLLPHPERQKKNKSKTEDHHLDDYHEYYERDSLPDKDGNGSRAMFSSTIPNANYYPSETENETWNSHEYPSGSPCESSDDQVQDPNQKGDEEDRDQDTNFVVLDMENSSTFLESDPSYLHNQNQHGHEARMSQTQISQLSSRLPPTIINKEERTEWGKSHQENDMAHCDDDDEIPLTVMSSVLSLPVEREQSFVLAKVKKVHAPASQVTDTDSEEDDEEEEEQVDEVLEKNEDESLDETGKPSGHGSRVLSTPIRRLMKTPMKKSTPRKLVRKPPVKSIFSGKGEVLIRTYSNGDYVTLHVVHAKNLQPSYRSSWKLAIKISLLPEAEATFTKSESVEVFKNRTGVKIDQKFSFEIAKSQNLEQKVFLTFWKRIEKKTSFLGWTTLSLSLLSSTVSRSTPSKSRSRSRNNNNNNDGKNKGLDCWFKLRKRKMSAASTSTYTPAAYNNSSKMNGSSNHVTNNNNSNNTTNRRTSGPNSKTSPLPLEIETLEEVQSPDTQDDNENENDQEQEGDVEGGHTDSHSHFHHHHHPDEIKSQFPNSSTMDSGVEDCCEPAVVQPSIDLDETQGKRVRVKMLKHENMGFGFSVVWVSPPRIERLEKDKTADLAGLKIGDLIIGVNGEDVTTVPNTTIYHNMKTTGSELELEVWRKNPPAPTPANVVKSNNPQIGSMVMMLMTGTGTGHPPKVTSPSPNPNPSPNPPNNHHPQHVANNNNDVNSPIRHAKQPPPSSATSAPLPSATHKPTGGSNGTNNTSTSHDDNSNHHHPHEQHHHHHHQQQQQQQTQPQQQQQQPQQQRPPPQQQPQQVPHQNSTAATTATNLIHNNNASSSNGGINNNNNINNNPPPPFKVQLPPVSILKPPPPAPPTGAAPPSPLISSHNHLQRNAMMTKKLPAHPQPTLASSSWKIRFNVELLDNEEDSLKQFFICELKFFRKVVAALDRYLIPAQANQLLTPNEIHSIFAHIITVITMTKRILQCVANGASKTGWRLGEILFSTHSDHISEITSAYTAYAKNLGNSSLILGEKMTLQNFARFVLETPVPKGHLDMTSLIFAPLEHLRNLCEICDEIVHHFEHWTEFATMLKDCYANIVVHTDFMEPISHISMKKHPLLSVRDLEKRIVSTSCQPMKVNEKGRKWLFGSRLFRKENDGSWAPVWAFLFTDIIVLTSHMTRDRVFFVKEAPIRLEDVVTLHFNLPRKNENEFRLLFGPEPSQTHYGRFERMLPLHRRPKCTQVVLRTTNLQLKAMWKLLLQRQIITLNTRLSKSSSSNFSISEFCEKFPDNEQTSRPTSARPHEEKIDEEPEEETENEENNERAGSVSSHVNSNTNAAQNNTINSNINYMKTTTNTGRPLATNYNYSSTPASVSGCATPSIERKLQEIKMDLHPTPTGSPISRVFNNNILNNINNSSNKQPSTTAGRDFRKEFNSPSKIVEEAEVEVEETERGSMERKRSVGGKMSTPATSDKIVEAAAAAALEVANMTAKTMSPTNSHSIIKYPQSRTIHVPDHKQQPQQQQSVADVAEKVLASALSSSTSSNNYQHPAMKAESIMSKYPSNAPGTPVKISQSQFVTPTSTPKKILPLTDTYIQQTQSGPAPVSVSSPVPAPVTAPSPTPASTTPMLNNINHSPYRAARSTSLSRPLLTNPNISPSSITDSPKKYIPLNSTLASSMTTPDSPKSNAIPKDQVPLPPAGLKLTSSNVTNTGEKQPLKLIDTGIGGSTGTGTRRTTPLNEKFSQKPVEMLTSPSEGSPSKSYLNRLKNPIIKSQNSTNANTTNVMTNNNNVHIHDLNRSAGDSSKCDCDGQSQSQRRQGSSGVAPADSAIKTNAKTSSFQTQTQNTNSSNDPLQGGKHSRDIDSNFSRNSKVKVRDTNNLTMSSNFKEKEKEIKSEVGNSMAARPPPSSSTMNKSSAITGGPSPRGSIVSSVETSFVVSSVYKGDSPRHNPKTPFICNNMSSNSTSSQYQSSHQPQATTSFSTSFLSRDNCSVEEGEKIASLTPYSEVMIGFPNKRSNDEKMPARLLLNNSSSQSPAVVVNEPSASSSTTTSMSNKLQREGAAASLAGASAGTSRAGIGEMKRNFFGPEKPPRADPLLERMNTDISMATNRHSAQATLPMTPTPAPKIMTNATLKNRQQEMIAAAASSLSTSASASTSSSSVNAYTTLKGSLFQSEESIISIHFDENGRILPSPAIAGMGIAMGKIVSSQPGGLQPLTTTSIGICEPSTKNTGKQYQTDNRAPARTHNSAENSNTTHKFNAAPSYNGNMGGSLNGSTNGNIKRNSITPSQSEIERCRSIGEGNNESNSCAKGKVYANSPIVSGFGSERSRRRLLYDLKVRRDYPELFGITPRDRRSFIKQLGDHDGASDNALVAPYYYHTRLSPLPLLKQLGLKSAAGMDHHGASPLTASSSSAAAVVTGAKALQQLKQIPGEASKIIGMATTSTIGTICSNKKGIGEKLHNYLGGGNAKISPATTTVSTSTSTPLSKNEFRHRLKLMESLDDDDEDASSSSSRPSVGGHSHTNPKNSNSNNYLGPHSKTDGRNKTSNSNEGIDEMNDSDDASLLDEEGSRVMDLMMNEKSITDGGLHHLPSHTHRRRSPEESSSNDSGISEEILIMTDTQCQGNCTSNGHSKNMTLPTDNICVSPSMTEEVSEDSNDNDNENDNDAPASISLQSATKPNEVISSAHNYTTKCAPACAHPATKSTNPNTSADKGQIIQNVSSINSIIKIHNTCLSDRSSPLRVRPVLPASNLLKNSNNVNNINNTSSDRTSVPPSGSSSSMNNNASHETDPKSSHSQRNSNTHFSNVSTTTSLSTSCTSSVDVHITLSPCISTTVQSPPQALTHDPRNHNSQPESDADKDIGPQHISSDETEETTPGTGNGNGMCSDKTMSSVCKDDKTGKYDDAKMSPLCLSVCEGETKNGVEGVVELAEPDHPSPPKEKVTMDKAIGTEDDDYMLDFSWIGRLPEKSYRTLMAERRDAFFHHPHHPNNNSDSHGAYPVPNNVHGHPNGNGGFMDSPPYNRHHPHHSYGYFYQHNNYSNSNPSNPSHRIKSNSSTITTVTSSSQPSSSSSYSCYLPPSSSNYFTGPESQAPTEPLLVKIYDGDEVHCTDDNLREKETESPILKKPCERVMYTRLEQQKTAKVERVESSDSSTSSSSDLASASPAAENGTTDPSWSSSSSSLAGYSSSMKEEPSPSTSKFQSQSQSQSQQYQPLPSSSPSLHSIHNNSSVGSSSVCNSNSNGYYSKSKSLLYMDDGSSCSTGTGTGTRSRPEIVVTKDSPEATRKIYTDNSTDDEDDDQATSNNSIVSNGWDKSRSSQSGGGKSEFLRVESNDSTAENYGDDDDYNFDEDDEEDLSHCSVATMNRYGTFESLEKINESEDAMASMPEFTRNMPRSKARFTFDDDDDDDEEDLFEEDFESDFNFRFPTQIQDNTYSVSRLGPLPPLLEEDFEDDMYEENGGGSESPSNSNGERKPHPSSGTQMDQAGVRSDGYLLARIATMYARSSISPLKIFRELLMKKRYRQWAYKE